MSTPTKNDNNYHLVYLGELAPNVPADTILSRTILTNEDLKVVLFGFAAGQELSEHTSTYPAVLHFLSGQATVTLGDDTITAEPGTWVYMPARLPHSIQAETRVVMLLKMLK